MQTAPIHQKWLLAHELTRDHLSDSQWTWLSYPHSLTQKLRERYGDKMQLALQSESWGLPEPDEATLLGISPLETCLLRKIHWLFNEEPWIKARVIIPASSTHDKGAELTEIGTRSLGDILFLDPNLKRSEFLFCGQKEHYSRRSIFHYYGKPILVQEDFLIEKF
jgi:chorismate--pyruvate lyase